MENEIECTTCGKIYNKIGEHECSFDDLMTAADACHDCGLDDEAQDLELAALDTIPMPE